MPNHHPLDPLSMEEIKKTCDILKKEKSLGEHHQFAYVELEEPTQEDIINYSEHLKPLDRIAFISVFDSKLNQTFEANVNLNTEEILRWELLPFDKYPYGQIPILPSDYEKCDLIVKSNQEWRKAVQQRGLSDDEIKLIHIEPFSPGYFGIKEDEGKRLVRAISYYRSNLTDNPYARPIEGVIAVVDLVHEQIVRIEDDGLNTPIPQTIINYDADSIKELREAPKPLDITQPEGPSFKVDGWQVNWQNWNLRIGFTPREGLVLHDISYLDGTQKRQVVARASVVDLAVPYGDPDLSQFFKAAFDSGENGFGRCANQLKLGCDCLGYIHYFDVPVADEHGNAALMNNAICMHEEDVGTLWKHGSETRRARELIISFFTTIDNYDYGFYWHLGQDGAIKLVIKLTGIVQTAAIAPGTVYQWGSMLTHELGAPTHQHFFSARLHMAVDGVNNSISERDFCSLPVTKDNRYGTAFGTKETILDNESEGVRDANAEKQRTWRIFNPDVLNSNRQPTGYVLEVNQTPLLFASNTHLRARAAYATHTLWVTPYNQQEKYASGNYPNQHAGGDGVLRYVQQNRSIANKPLVLWVTVGKTHLSRPEDFPVMPVETVELKLKPSGFFNHNPAIGLPLQRNTTSVKHAETGKSCCSTKTSTSTCGMFTEQNASNRSNEASSSQSSSTHYGTSRRV